MLKVAICDDDYSVCSAVEEMILEYSTMNNERILVDIFYEGQKLLHYMEQENCFDLIFLDIELRTTTGIDVGRQIRNEMDDYISKIVFISSTKGYERQLFEVQPLNFLEKPIEKAKLWGCIDLAIKILEREKKVFKYQVGHQFRQIMFQDILYFESKLRKVRMIAINKADEFYDTINHLQHLLPKNFVRTHGSYVVNFNHIAKIAGETIVMKNGDIIPISKRNLKEIHRMQIQFVKELRDVTV